MRGGDSCYNFRPMLHVVAFDVLVACGAEKPNLRERSTGSVVGYFWPDDPSNLARISPGKRNHPERTHPERTQRATVCCRSLSLHSSNRLLCGKAKVKCSLRASFSLLYRATSQTQQGLLQPRCILRRRGSGVGLSWSYRLLEHGDNTLTYHFSPSYTYLLVEAV